MKKNPLVSIIIPVYNEERYLDYCLSSLFEQSYNNIEIIIVDDGSTDKSLAIVKKYDVRIIKQNHQGPGAARNYGAMNAKGEILCFFDADIRYDKKHIEKLIHPIIYENVVGTFQQEERVANTDNIWANCWTINGNLPIGERIIYKLSDTLSIFRAIKKSDFLLVGGYDQTTGYGEDVTVSPKLHKVAVAAPGAIAYHFNPESLDEVFFSARWIGRGMQDEKTLKNLLAFSLPNSIRHIIKKIQQGAPIQFIIFKIVFDFGMFCGIFLSFGKKVK